MRSTIIATLALGFATAIGGGVCKVFDLSGGNGLLISGVFLSIIGTSLLVLDQAGRSKHQNQR